MKQENLNILIKLRQEGLQELDKLITGLEEAGGEAGEFKQRADALNRQLAELEKQQGLIDAFRRTKDETQAASRAYETAQQRRSNWGVHCAKPKRLPSASEPLLKARAPR